MSGLCALAHVVEVREQTVGVGSLLLPRVSRDQIQVIRLAGKCFHPLSQLTDPLWA